MSERTLELIKNDLRVISSNKLNSYQSKLFLVGILYEIILRKDLFPRNSDLKKFVQLIVVEPIKTIPPFREYLFLSRTLLGSRVSSIILSHFEFKNVVKTVDVLNDILPDKERAESNTNRQSNDSDLDEWINFLRGNAN
jgi:hypothetical protein